MYVFVFMWTPALKALTVPSQAFPEEAGGEEGSSGPELPFGLIFATFMVSCMAGSSIFSMLVTTTSIETMAVYVFGVSFAAMTMVSFGNTDVLVYLGMLLFEVCVGMYFPIMGTM